MSVLRNGRALAQHRLIAPTAAAAIDQVAARYAVAITPALADLIDTNDPADPIARQFVPDGRELSTSPEERADPIGDAAHSPCEGLVHRYPDRVLLKIAGTCAVYCRFCFRREMVGPGRATGLSDASLDGALRYIAGRREIWEVILTGGDPLVLAPRRLAAICSRLAAIDHVRVLRIHTRLPIAAPDRVTSSLVDALQTASKTLYVAIHANHPRELTPAARAACDRLRAGGASLISQSVLLRGVNDHVETLTALMRAFVEAQIQPYYLHHPDLAPGTSHLRVSIAEGQALVAALRGHVSGLCQPHYVLDIPGGHGKTPIGPTYLHAVSDDTYHVRDFKGGSHLYPPEGDEAA